MSSQEPSKPKDERSPELLMEQVANALNLEVERYAQTHTPAEVAAHKQNADKVKEMYLKRYNEKKIE